MIAAIYARKSTEQQGVSDEDKSVTRQIDHAKAYAAEEALDGRRGAHLLGRRDQRRRVREAARLPTPDECPEAATSLPSPHHERGVSSRA